MRGKAMRFCALLLVLLCVAAHFQGAYCRGGGGGGRGGGGGGRGGGGSGRGGSGGRSGGGRGGYGRPFIGGAGAGILGGTALSHGHRHNGAGEPRGRGVWRVSGAAAALAAVSLVWWC